MSIFRMSNQDLNHPPQKKHADIFLQSHQACIVYVADSFHCNWFIYTSYWLICPIDQKTTKITSLIDSLWIYRIVQYLFCVESCMEKSHCFYPNALCNQPSSVASSFIIYTGDIHLILPITMLVLSEVLWFLFSSFKVKDLQHLNDVLCWATSSTSLLCFFVFNVPAIKMVMDVTMYQCSTNWTIRIDDYPTD